MPKEEQSEAEHDVLEDELSEWKSYADDLKSALEEANEKIDKAEIAIDGIDTGKIDIPDEPK